MELDGPAGFKSVFGDLPGSRAAGGVARGALVSRGGSERGTAGLGGGGGEDAVG